MIELHGVTYTYPSQASPAVRDVDLSVPAGSFLLLVGPSGAGKSTLLRCLNGLVPHFYGGSISGRVRVVGRDPVALGPRAMSDVVGFVFQDPEAQFVTQQVEDELAFALENHNIPQALMRKRVEEALDQLSIAHLRHRRVDTLSGGERQLVAIAGVLTLQPSVLVLDEPTSQLDPQAAEEVLTILQKLNQDLGLTVVISEHRLERVAQYADLICYLSGRGTAPIVGAPRDVLAQVDLVPPLVQLGRKLGWQPLPLTIKEGRPFAATLMPQLMGKRTAGDGSRQPAPSGRRIGDEVGDAQGRRLDDQPAIAARDLWFRYNGQDTLRGISFSVNAGEFVALMGRNGAGKSTLLKNLVGMLRPRQGSLEVLGKDARRTDLPEMTRRVGFVPQNPGRLLFKETLAEELEFTCRAHSLATSGNQAVLDRLGLGGLAQAYPRDLSTGERQRAALAAILVAQPDVLLLDEPTRGLDYASKERLVAILKGLQQQGVTILMATHDVELVAQCAQRVIVLGEGEVVVDGPVHEVMTGSMVFASQVNRLLRDDRFLTVDDVMSALGERTDA